LIAYIRKSFADVLGIMSYN